MKRCSQKINFWILAAVLLGFLATFGRCAAAPQSTMPSAPVQNSVSSARNTFVVQAVQRVSPAVVGITDQVYAVDNSDQRVLIGRGGSGVIFDPNGYIVTNSHVVDGVQEVAVSLADGRTVKGKVLGADPATDLAVVKVELTGLPTAVFGDSESLRVGEPAIAIGSPLGLEFQGSVTLGVISALHRSIEVGDRRFKLLQTDAAINPGNSGGALVNADGEIVGINSIKVAAVGIEGIGFAIPVNSARPILQELIEKGRVIRGYLGVSAFDRKTALLFGYDLELDQGVLVVRVDKNGPASKVDIHVGDIILKIDDSEVNSVADLRALLEKSPIGSKLSVLIIRDGQMRTVNPVVEETPI